MAKRKRLTPANPDLLGGAPAEGATNLGPDLAADLPEPASSDPVQDALPAPGTDPLAGLSPEDRAALTPTPMLPDLETKAFATQPPAYPMGVAPTRTISGNRARPKPPIAQVAAEASAEAALRELSAELNRARSEGRMIQSLPLSDIDTGHLVRDRMFTEEEDLAALVESLRRRGQQSPIEVVDRGQGTVPRYGLISGWRRMAALSRLQGEDPRFGRVLALVRAPKSASEAYVAMVEENEIRVGLSYYERARVTLKSVEQGVYADLKIALNTLFANVSRAKRSKIKSFTRLVEALDGQLSFPTQIGERLGLEMARRMDEEPELAAALQARLDSGFASAEEEQAALTALLRPKTEPETGQGGNTPALSVPEGKDRERGPDKGQGGGTVGTRTQATSPVPEGPGAAVEGGVAVQYDPAGQQVVLTGVDVDLHEALLAWLRSR